MRDESPSSPDTAHERETTSEPASEPADPRDGNPDDATHVTSEEDDTPSRSLLRASLPSLAMAGGVLALEWLRVGFQNRRMFKPEALEGEEAEPSAFDLPAEDQWFTADGGVTLHGWWISHHRPRATILFCHGNTGNLAYYFGVFRYLARLGVSIFAFDYRGYGQSTGKPSEAGIYLDAQAAWDHVTTTLGVLPHDVLLFGHSLGGAVAIDLAGRRPVPALVVQSTFTDMRAIARRLHSPAHLVARNAFRNLEKVGSLTMPKLFIHGDADPKIPIAMGQELFAAAAEPKAWYAVPDALHNNLHLADDQGYFEALSRFIGDHFDVV